jgi:hypothetical protein
MKDTIRSTNQSIGNVYSAICKPIIIRLDRISAEKKSSDPEHSKGNGSL